MNDFKLQVAVFELLSGLQRLIQFNKVHCDKLLKKVYG